MTKRQKQKRRRRSDLILRLIDVVLILLFGFIAISEVSQRSKIELAESSTVPAAAPDREEVVYIGVLPDQRYLVEGETRLIEDDASLLGYIRSKRSELNGRNLRMRVRVRANHNAPVQPAFRVVNFCQQMKIPVGLDVVKKTGV